MNADSKGRDPETKSASICVNLRIIFSGLGVFAVLSGRIVHWREDFLNREWPRIAEGGNGCSAHSRFPSPFVYFGYFVVFPSSSPRSLFPNFSTGQRLLLR